MVPNTATGVPVTGNQGSNAEYIIKGPPFLFWGILHSLLTVSEGPQIPVDHIFLPQERHCSRSQLRSSETGLPVWRPGLVTAAGRGKLYFVGNYLDKTEFSWKLFQQFSFSLAIYRRLKLRLEVKLNKPSSIHRYFWQKHDANYNYKLSKIFHFFGSMDIFYENILSDSSPSAFLRHYLSSTMREGCPVNCCVKV